MVVSGGIKRKRAVVCIFCYVLLAVCVSVTVSQRKPDIVLLLSTRPEYSKDNYYGVNIYSDRTIVIMFGHDYTDYTDYKGDLSKRLERIRCTSVWRLTKAEYNEILSMAATVIEDPPHDVPSSVLPRARYLQELMKYKDVGCVCYYQEESSRPLNRLLDFIASLSPMEIAISNEYVGNCKRAV